VGVFSRRLVGLSFFIAGFVAGCATGGGDDSASGDDASMPTGDDDGSAGDGAATGDGPNGSNDGPQSGDGATADGNGDGGPVDAPPDVPQVPCSDGGIGGIGIPAGTVATASGMTAGQTPSLAIDGHLQTYWNGGGMLESLTLTFPTGQTFSGVVIAASASPTSSETYTITGTEAGILKNLGMATMNVPATNTVLPVIPVTPGTYTDITFHVSAVSSPVIISEVTLVTPSCP
jgi:hypothetical protein